jgi:hypothetical protein
LLSIKLRVFPVIESNIKFTSILFKDLLVVCGVHVLHKNLFGQNPVFEIVIQNFFVKHSNLSIIPFIFGFLESIAMFSVLPFAKAVGSVFLFLFFGCLAVLIGCPIVDKAKLIRVATPVDKYFVFVAIICTLYIICASCIVKRVLVPVVLEVIDAHFPQAVSKSTTLRLSVLSNKLNWGHKVVGHWSYCSLLHIVFQRSVELKAQNFTTVSFVRKEVHDVKLVRVI